MRIALFSDTYIPEINGVATATATLRNAFIKHGHTCYVVTTNPNSNKMEYDDGVLRIPGILLKKLYNYRLAGFLHPKATLIIKSWNLDIIHVQTEAGVGIYGRMLAPKLDVPLISTYHTMLVDYTYYVTHGYFDQPAKAIVKQFVKAISSACTEFTTPSVKTKDALRTYGIDRYINVIPNGIDLSKYDSSKIDVDKIKNYRKEHHLEDTFILLSLGRVAEEKSNDVLLKGYANFLKLNPAVKTKMLIVGDGPARKDLETLSYELGIAEYVDFIGKVDHDEVPFYYALADLYLSASITETQGLTFIESIAAKTPVLCRFDENLSSVIIDGVTGFYFQDENNFATRLNQIISLKKEDLNRVIEEAYIRNEVYSIDKFYERMMEVYHRALRKNW